MNNPWAKMWNDTVAVNFKLPLPLPAFFWRQGNHEKPKSGLTGNPTEIRTGYLLNESLEGLAFIIWLATRSNFEVRQSARLSIVHLCFRVKGKGKVVPVLF
jgi:hypothetical protein